MQDSKLTLKSKLKGMQQNEVLNYAWSCDMKQKDQNMCERASAGRREPRLQCKFCGKVHIMKKEECQAWDKTCMSCAERNYFAAVCQQSRQSKQHVRTV